MLLLRNRLAGLLDVYGQLSVISMVQQKVCATPWERHETVEQELDNLHNLKLDKLEAGSEWFDRATESTPAMVPRGALADDGDKERKRRCVTAMLTQIASR
jgi:hypothetical protein